MKTIRAVILCILMLLSTSLNMHVYAEGEGSSPDNPITGACTMTPIENSVNSFQIQCNTEESDVDFTKTSYMMYIADMQKEGHPFITDQYGLRFGSTSQDPTILFIQKTDFESWKIPYMNDGTYHFYMRLDSVYYDLGDQKIEKNKNQLPVISGEFNETNDFVIRASGDNAADYLDTFINDGSMSIELLVSEGNSQNIDFTSYELKSNQVVFNKSENTVTFPFAFLKEKGLVQPTSEGVKVTIQMFAGTYDLKYLEISVPEGYGQIKTISLEAVSVNVENEAVVIACDASKDNGCQDWISRTKTVTARTKTVTAKSGIHDYIANAYLGDQKGPLTIDTENNKLSISLSYLRSINAMNGKYQFVITSSSYETLITDEKEFTQFRSVAPTDLHVGISGEGLVIYSSDETYMKNLSEDSTAEVYITPQSGGGYTIHMKTGKMEEITISETTQYAFKIAIDELASQDIQSGSYRICLYSEMYTIGTMVEGNKNFLSIAEVLKKAKKLMEVKQPSVDDLNSLNESLEGLDTATIKIETAGSSSIVSNVSGAGALAILSDSQGKVTTESLADLESKPEITSTVKLEEKDAEELLTSSGVKSVEAIGGFGVTLTKQIGEKTETVSELCAQSAIELDLSGVTLAKDEELAVVRIHEGSNGPQIDTLPVVVDDSNKGVMYTNQYSDFVLVKRKKTQAVVNPTGGVQNTISNNQETVYDPNDKNHDGVVTCDEIHGVGWVWNNARQACEFNAKGYVVPNTGVRN